MWGWVLQAPLTEYWSDFESENGFGKVLPLATILVKDFIAQRYSFTLQGPIRTNPNPQIIGPTGPWTNSWTDFESENGFEKGLQLATKLVFANPSRPNTKKVPSLIL
jgi:hypothetical protein